MRALRGQGEDDGASKNKEVQRGHGAEINQDSEGQKSHCAPGNVQTQTERRIENSPHREMTEELEGFSPFAQEGQSG